MPIKSSIILITGASSGIGKAAALKLAKKNHVLILVARNSEKLKLTQQEIQNQGGVAHFYSCDLTQIELVKNLAEKVSAEIGIPDVVINSAGSGEWLSFQESSLEHFRDTMESPYLATAYVCKVFYELMKPKKRGHFIIVNSAASYFTFPHAGGYSASRSALLAFGRSLKIDFKGSNFLVSAVVLGKVNSSYFQNNPISEQRIPKIAKWLIPTLSVEKSADIIAQSIISKKAEIVRPRILRLFAILNALFPRVFGHLLKIGSSNSKLE